MSRLSPTKTVGHSEGTITSDLSMKPQVSVNFSQLEDMGDMMDADLDDFDEDSYEETDNTFSSNSSLCKSCFSICR